MQFQHVTRWKQGENPDDYKWKNYTVRNQRYRLVSGALFDMEKDPGQEVNMAEQNPDLVSEMKSAYEKFWDESRSRMINEDATLAKEKPFHVDYNKQKAAGGIPDWKAPSFEWDESYTGGPTAWATRKPKKDKKKKEKAAK